MARAGPLEALSPAPPPPGAAHPGGSEGPDRRVERSQRRPGLGPRGLCRVREGSAGSQRALWGASPCWGSSSPVPGMLPPSPRQPAPVGRVGSASPRTAAIFGCAFFLPGCCPHSFLPFLPPRPAGRVVSTGLCLVAGQRCAGKEAGLPSLTSPLGSRGLSAHGIAFGSGSLRPRRMASPPRGGPRCWASRLLPASSLSAVWRRLLHTLAVDR